MMQMVKDECSTPESESPLFKKRQVKKQMQKMNQQNIAMIRWGT